ncbi:MAG: hypothetical protein VX185_01535 [Pseudomonadota bacterium]|nr:hypothetical protein [Pseudomonadota bacterium]
MLEASQTTTLIDGQNKVIDFNKDGGEFTAEERDNMEKFMEDPTQANAQNLAVVVRDATRDDENAAMSMKDVSYWNNYIDNLYENEQPNREDYDLNDPQELQEFTMKEQEFNTKLKYLQTIKEMYSKATGGWADHARTSVNNVAF